MKKKAIAVKLIAFCAGLMPATWSFGQQISPKFPDRAMQMIVPFGPGGTTDCEKFKQVVKQHNLQEK